MKTFALVVGGLILPLSGCAHQQDAVKEEDVGANGIAIFLEYQFESVPPEQQRLAPKMERPIRNTGVIRAMRGEAEVSGDGGKTWRRARVGIKLGMNSVIRTGKGKSDVDVFLGYNGPILRVKPESVIYFDRLDLENKGAEKVIHTQIELQRGQILGLVKKTSKASRYVIRTPRNIVGISEANYSVTAQGEVKVTLGTVSVHSLQHRHSVETGFAFSPETGIQQIPKRELQNVSDEIAVLEASFVYLPDGEMITSLQGLRKCISANPNGSSVPCSDGVPPPLQTGPVYLSPPKRLDAY